MPDPPWIHDCGKSSYGRQDEYAVETEHDYAVEEMETDNDSLNSVRALELQQLIMRGETQINADLERAANLVIPQPSTILTAVHNQADPVSAARQGHFLSHSQPASELHVTKDRHRDDRAPHLARTKSTSAFDGLLDSHPDGSHVTLNLGEALREGCHEHSRKMATSQVSQARSGYSAHDTQPFNSWEADRNTKNASISQEAHTRLLQPTSDTPVVGYNAARALDGGPQGHVNLPESVGEDVSEYNPTAGSPGGGHESVVDTSSPRFQGDVFPESKRFQQPETPALQNKKRLRNGEPASPSVTPSLPVNPFAGQGLAPVGMMGLSQVFAATQDGGRFEEGVPSDPLSERPSPEMFFVRRRSSFTESFSSPTRPASTPLPRKPGDPISTYTTMAESQAEREKALRELRSASANARLGDVSSDDELNPGESGNLRRKLKLERINRAAMKELEAVRVPRRAPETKKTRENGKAVRGTRRHGRKPGESQIGATPLQTRVPGPVVISDGIEADRSDGAESEETDSELETVIGQTPSGDGKPYKDGGASQGYPEEGVQVPRTSLQSRRGIKDTQSSPSGPRGAHLPQAAKTYQNISATPEEIAKTKAGRTDEIGMALVVAGTQTEAIVDSQPSPSKVDTCNVQSSSAPPSPTMPSSNVPHLLTSESQLSTLRDPQYHMPGEVITESSSIPNPPTTSDENGNSSSQTRLQQPHVFTGTQSDLQAPSKPLEGAGVAETRPLASNEHRSPEPTEEVVHCSSPPMAGSTTFIASHGRSGHDVGLVGTKSIEGDVPSAVSSKPVAGYSPVLGAAIPNTSSPVSRLAVSPANARRGGASQSNIDDIHEHNVSNTETNETGSPGRHGQQSHATTLFETAQSHFDESASRSPSQETRPRTHPLQDIPVLVNERRRTLTEIAQDPSPPDVIGDIDMHDLGLLNSQDAEFRVALDGSSPIGPARKRRRGRDGRALRESHERSNHAPALPSSSGKDSVAPAPAPLGVKKSYPALDNIQKPADPRPGRLEKPAKQLKPAKQSIPKAKPSARTSENQPPSASIPGRPDKPSATTAIPTVVKTYVGARRFGALPARHEEQARPRSPERDETNTNPLDAEATDMKGIRVPNRVFALFNGSNSAYYPATCLGVFSGNRTTYRVRFDDGTVDTLQTHQIRRLDFRLGDVVKVDLARMRTKNYAIVGFKDQMNPHVDPDPPAVSRQALAESEQYPLTDIKGYLTVLLIPKQRDHLGADNAAANVEPIGVPITSTYIVQSNWVNYQDRVYIHPSTEPSRSTSRAGTPQNHIITTPHTPSTRSRRLMTPAAANLSTSSVASPAVKPKNCSGIFDNMTFAVSYSFADRDDERRKEDERRRVIEQIQNNGGRVLSEGFEELFEHQGASPGDGSASVADTLRPTREAHSLGFVCLIANIHSRKAKYMQALALGLPCLAGRWIEDSVARSKVLDWEPYLLPSGESTFLRGAIRSRVLQPHRAETARFIGTVTDRKMVIEGRSVLLVVGTARAQQELRKAYVFLTCALGATRVERVGTVEEARRKIVGATERETWDWVYVDEAEPAATTLLEAGSGGALAGGSASKSKKRKRTSATAEQSVLERAQPAESPAAVERLKRVKVVGNDFVTQSLILGRLVDED